MPDKLLQIQNMIYEIRGQKVMLDNDLAGLYQVEVKALNRTVKRNLKRFPGDFMFQLSNEESTLFMTSCHASALKHPVWQAAFHTVSTTPINPIQDDGLQRRVYRSW